MRKTLLFFFVLLFSTSVFAQAPFIQWQRSLGGSGSDQANSIQQTADGGYIVAGLSNSNNDDVSGNHGNYDYWIVKLNDTGGIQWQKSLGGSAHDEAHSIQQTTDGGYIVGGYSSSNDDEVSGNHGGSDYWVVKLNDTGAIQWQRSLGGDAIDIARAVEQTVDGGYIVAGYTTSDNGDVSGSHGAIDFWVAKLDDTGAIVWQKCLGGSAGESAFDIRQTSDGGYIVAGESISLDGEVSGNHGNFDDWIVKLNDTGAIQWQKSLGGAGFENVYCIRQLAGGGYIFASASQSNDGEVSGHRGDSTLPDYWIVKINDTGAILWQKSMGGTGYDAPSCIQQTADSGYIVSGLSTSNDVDVSGNHGGHDYWIVKLNDTGAIKWQKSLGGSGDDYATAVQQTVDGGYIVAGSSNSNDSEVSGNHGGTDFWIVKLICDINIGAISAESHICPGSSMLLADTTAGGAWSLSNIHATLSGSRVTGVTAGLDTAIYTVTNACGATAMSFPFSIVACEAVSQVIPADPIAIIPNPTTGNISVTGASNVHIKVYNTIGQLIEEAHNTDHVSITALPAGLYFVRVFNENGLLISQDRVVKE